MLVVAAMWLLAPLLAAAQTPLRLSPDESVLHTTGHLQWLRDTTSDMTAAQAAKSMAWADLPGNVNAGYTDDAIWLRLRLDAPQPGQWVLLLSNPLLDSVHVYIHRPSGDWDAIGVTGEDVPRPQWPVASRNPAIEFNLDRPGEQTLLVRLAARNAVKTQFSIWKRLAFDNHTRREGLFFGLHFGFYLLLICLHGLFWQATRAPLSGLFLAYIGSCVLNEVLTIGLVQQITGWPGAVSDRVLGVSMTLSFPIAMQLAVRQLLLYATHPRVGRALLVASWCTGLVGMALVLAGHFAWGVLLLQAVASPALVLLFGMAFFLLRRGNPNARFFLIVFGTFYASLLVAFARNLGLLPLNVVTEYVSVLGVMVHMVLLSLWIVGSYVRQRRALEREQMQLQLELAQRQHRESELLDALELERRVRQEQRDFVAMVSHEFRTPLAIISTCAQQLGRNLAAPPETTLGRSHHIRAAAQRLLALVDDCLADDRMDYPQAMAHSSPCDLYALLDGLSEEFAPGRIACVHEEGTRHLATDGALLRIALRNLLANAERHAPAGTCVQVHTRCEAHRLCIEVANSGPAIPPEEQAHMFERYFRGQSARGQPGSGLGLYLVRRIAEKLGGSVALVSGGGDAPVRLRLELSSFQE